MTKFNRRDLMVGAGGLVTSLLVRRSVAEAGGSSIPPAPVARVAVVKDTYFGETLSDPYRWMENDKDPDWLPFLKGQNAHARAVLDTIPGRAALLARIQQLSGDTAVTRRVQRAGGKLFFEQRPVGADNFKLFVQEGGTDRVLIDPTLKSDAKQPPVAGLVAPPHRTARTWCTGSPRTAARTRSCTSSPWPTARPARADPQHRDGAPAVAR